jgi:hypothetical protein
LRLPRHFAPRRRLATCHLQKVPAVDSRAGYLDHQLIGGGLIDVALGNDEVVTNYRQRPHVGVTLPHPSRTGRQAWEGIFRT